MLNRLLERYFAEDDEDAISELVSRTRPRLLRAAARICPQAAEDAVQTAYLSLAKQQALEAPVLPWLMKAVVRVAYRHRARLAKEHEIARRLAPSRAPAPPSAHAVGQEEAALLERELHRLPANYRDAIQLHHLHGLSVAETARLLSLNESTVRTHLRRGRRLLHSRLSKLLYPVLAFPWWLADTAGASALILEVTMKTKAAIAVLAVLMLALFGVIVVKTRDSAAPQQRSQGRRGMERSGPVPGARTDNEESSSARPPAAATSDAS